MICVLQWGNCTLSVAEAPLLVSHWNTSMNRPLWIKQEQRNKGNGWEDKFAFFFVFVKELQTSPLSPVPVVLFRHNSKVAYYLACWKSKCLLKWILGISSWILNHFPSSSNPITINFFIRVARKKIKNETIIILIEVIKAWTPFLTFYNVVVPHLSVLF